MPPRRGRGGYGRGGNPNQPLLGKRRGGPEDITTGGEGHFGDADDEFNIK